MIGSSGAGRCGLCIDDVVCIDHVRMWVVTCLGGALGFASMIEDEGRQQQQKQQKQLENGDRGGDGGDGSKSASASFFMRGSYPRGHFHRWQHVDGLSFVCGDTRARLPGVYSICWPRPHQWPTFNTQHTSTRSPSFKTRQNDIRQKLQASFNGDQSPGTTSA